MSKVREESNDDSEQLADSARRLSDWREYVRAYPWAAAGGAALVGFLLTPTRCQSHSGEPTRNRSWVGSLTNLVAMGIGKAALSYVTQSALDSMSDDVPEDIPGAE